LTDQDPHAGTSCDFRAATEFDLAHGISGPLALLSLAMRHGVVVVDGHVGAIGRICA